VIEVRCNSLTNTLVVAEQRLMYSGRRERRERVKTETCMQLASTSATREHSCSENRNQGLGYTSCATTTAGRRKRLHRHRLMAIASQENADTMRVTSFVHGFDGQQMQLLKIT
jgi:hypothetical protein